MDKPLILMDVDGTLLNSSFQITVSGLVPLIAQLQQKGFKFGLHSDSPFHRARRIAAQLEISGPLICELGNAVHSDLRAVKPVWEDEDNVALFRELHAKFIMEMKEDYPTSNILLADIESVLQWLPSVKIPLFAGVVTWIIVNHHRRHSFCFNTRQLSPINGFELNPKALHHLAPIALRLFEKIFGCAPKSWLNEKPYCSYFLHAPDSRKDKANPILFDRLGYKKIIMIGDNPIDLLHDDAVVQCAVGNATPEYQQACAFAAEATYTEGVKECLSWVEQNF